METLWQFVVSHKGQSQNTLQQVMLQTVKSQKSKA